MMLWSWHAPDFSLLHGRVDPDKSDQVRSVKGAREAYRKLAELLGTSQFDWCFTVDQEWGAETSIEVRWVLDVPPSAILQFVNVIVWHRILKTSYVPREKGREWSYEALKLYPNNKPARERYERKQKEAYLSEPPPNDGWWSVLFVESQIGEHVNALIPHPVRPEWVAKNPLSNADA